MNEAIAAAREMSLGEHIASLGLPMAGNKYVCPFCGSGSGPNGTSAFYVYHDKRFRCYRCNENGNLLDFVMSYNKCSFKEAVNILGLGKIKMTGPRITNIQIGWKIGVSFYNGYTLIDTGKRYPYHNMTDVIEAFEEWEGVLEWVPYPVYINAQTVLKKAHSLTRMEICAYELKFPYHILNDMVRDVWVDDATMMENINRIFSFGGYYDVGHEDWPVLVYYLTRFFPPNTFQMQPSSE